MANLDTGICLLLQEVLLWPSARSLRHKTVGMVSVLKVLATWRAEQMNPKRAMTEHKGKENAIVVQKSWQQAPHNACTSYA